jgi:hypothetical protein
MSNFDHISDLVQARETIKNISERLAVAKLDVDKWKIDFDVQVVKLTDAGEEFELLIKATVGDRGTQIKISQQEILYHAVDLEAIAKMLSRNIMLELLEENAAEALAPAFIRAANNIVALTRWSSL